MKPTVNISVQADTQLLFFSTRMYDTNGLHTVLT